jgi:hypothetical protein
MSRHPFSSRLPYPITTQNSQAIEDALNDILEEIDCSRGVEEGIEDRLDQLEMAVLLLATHISNVWASRGTA